MPNTFNPMLGVWAANASSLRGPWTRSNTGGGAGGREASWSATAPTDSLGWIATGDMAQHAPGGERRWYYVGFDPSAPVPSGWFAPVHTTSAHPQGSAPALIALSMMHRGGHTCCANSSGGTAKKPTKKPTAGSTLYVSSDTSGAMRQGETTRSLLGAMLLGGVAMLCSRSV